MNWYYYDGAKQVGPISQEELLQAYQRGSINGQSLVWREGMANWEPYCEAFPQSATAPGQPPLLSSAAAGAGQAVCAECGRVFNTDDMFQHGALHICGNCKPLFLQRIREGTLGFSMRSPGSVPESQIRERDYEHTIGDYLEQSWRLLKSDPGTIIGACALVGLCWCVANFMPYIGGILGLIFSGPLIGGLALFYLGRMRGRNPAVGDAFGGFGPRFGPLLLAHLVPNLLVMVPLILPALIIGAGIIILFVSSQSGSSPPPAFTALMVSGVIFLLPAIGVMLYLQYCWLFALWLVADKNMTFWPAMALSRAVVRKHWWMTFWLGIVMGIIIFAGVLCCGVGLLVSGPVALGMMAFAYEKLFGDMQPA